MTSIAEPVLTKLKEILPNHPDIKVDFDNDLGYVITVKHDDIHPKFATNRAHRIERELAAKGIDAHVSPDDGDKKVVVDSGKENFFDALDKAAEAMAPRR